MSPVDPDRLEHHLKQIGYDRTKTKFLVDGFRYGFRLQHESQATTTAPKNDPSIDALFSVAKEKIDKEVASGRMKGPFDEPPFEEFHISPIKLTEKSVKNTYRLIHNLSWPYDDTSINSQIPPEYKTVQYANVNKAINLIMRFPRGSYTRKTDIKHAFKLIPIHPDDHHKLGLTLDGKYYYDVTLPMGASSACQIFEAFSTALQAIYDFHATQGGLSTHYLDDFFFIDITYAASIANEKIFDGICLDLGVPQAPDKKTAPSMETEFLGILLDSGRWLASLPLAKVRSYCEELQSSSQRSKLTQKELQSVVGKLSFASTVVPARSFLRRLISRIHSVERPYHYIKLTRDMLEDIYTWLQFLDQYNGVTYFRSLKILPKNHLNMGADASKLGFGCTFGRHWLQDPYPRAWQRLYESSDIGSTVLELYPILVLIGVFGSAIENSSILFHSDNIGVVQVINKQSSSRPIIMEIVRPLVLLLMKHNISLLSQHIQGSKNILCDTISRFKVTPALLLRYGMDPDPTPIPLHLQSNNFKLNTSKI